MGFSFPILLIGISRKEVAIMNLLELHPCAEYEGRCAGNTGHYLIISAWFLSLKADFRTTLDLTSYIHRFPVSVHEN